MTLLAERHRFTFHVRQKTKVMTVALSNFKFISFFSLADSLGYSEKSHHTLVLVKQSGVKDSNCNKIFSYCDFIVNHDIRLRMSLVLGR